MATIVKTPSGTWKALIHKTGWPPTAKTFRTKRDAEDWSRRTEDEMVRGVYIQRGPAERMTVEVALNRYLREVTPTKRESTQAGERKKALALTRHLGKYSLAALSSEIVAQYRDTRLAGDDNAEGKPAPRSNNTVRLELALLSHLFTIAIKEWDIGLPFNPVSNIRRPAPGAGRNRRLTVAENKRLLAAVDAYSNPMFSWIVRGALETGMRLSEIAGFRFGQLPGITIVRLCRFQRWLRSGTGEICGNQLPITCTNENVVRSGSWFRSMAFGRVLTGIMRSSAPLGLHGRLAGHCDHGSQTPYH